MDYKFTFLYKGTDHKVIFFLTFMYYKVTLFNFHRVEKLFFFVQDVKVTLSHKVNMPFFLF